MFKTTTVRGLAAATAEIKASWSPGKERSRRSKASLLKSLANTTATWAAGGAGGGGDVVRRVSQAQGRFGLRGGHEPVEGDGVVMTRQ